MKRIGERIKKKRELLNLHLNELAEKVGVSPSALSQIENAKSFPSLLTLKSIAENLHTSVGELIGENELLVNNPVVEKKDIKFVEQSKSGTMVYLLSHHDINKQMDTYLLRFPKASGLDSLFGKTFGQVFCYVLSGELKVDLNSKTYLLKNGDSVYFNARSSYDVVNYADGVSEVLWIQSPPNF